MFPDNPVRQCVTVKRTPRWWSSDKDQKGLAFESEISFDGKAYPANIIRREGISGHGCGFAALAID
jgi:hypothetical protein